MTSEESRRAAWGYGLATLTEWGAILDTWYPDPSSGEPPPDAGRTRSRPISQRWMAAIRTAGCASRSCGR